MIINDLLDYITSNQKVIIIDINSELLYEGTVRIDGEVPTELMSFLNRKLFLLTSTYKGELVLNVY